MDGLHVCLENFKRINHETLHERREGKLPEQHYRHKGRNADNQPH